MGEETKELGGRRFRLVKKGLAPEELQPFIGELTSRADQLAAERDDLLQKQRELEQEVEKLRGEVARLAEEGSELHSQMEHRYSLERLAEAKVAAAEDLARSAEEEARSTAERLLAEAERSAESLMAEAQSRLDATTVHIEQYKDELRREVGRLDDWKTEIIRDLKGHFQRLILELERYESLHPPFQPTLGEQQLILPEAESATTTQPPVAEAGEPMAELAGISGVEPAPRDEAEAAPLIEQALLQELASTPEGAQAGEPPPELEAVELDLSSALKALEARTAPEMAPSPGDGEEQVLPPRNVELVATPLESVADLERFKEVLMTIPGVSIESVQSEGSGALFTLSTPSFQALLEGVTKLSGATLSFPSANRIHVELEHSP